MDPYRTGGRKAYRQHRRDDEYTFRPEPEVVSSAFDGRPVPVVNGVPQWDAPLDMPPPGIRHVRGHRSSQYDRLAARFSRPHSPPSPAPIRSRPPRTSTAPFSGHHTRPPERRRGTYDDYKDERDKSRHRSSTTIDPDIIPPPRVPSPPPIPDVRRTFTMRDPSPPPIRPRPPRTSTAPFSGHHTRSPERRRETYDDYGDERDKPRYRSPGRHRSPERYEHERFTERIYEVPRESAKYRRDSDDELPRGGAARKSWEADIPIRGSGHDPRRAVDPRDDVGAARTHSPEPVIPRDRRGRSPPPEHTKSPSTRRHQHQRHPSRGHSDSEHRRNAPRPKRQGQGQGQGHRDRNRPGSPITGRGSLYEKDMEERAQRLAHEEPIVIPNYKDEDSDDSEAFRRARKAQKAKSRKDPYVEDYGSTRSRKTGESSSSRPKKAPPPSRVETEPRTRSTPKKTRRSTMPGTKPDPRYTSRKDSIPTGNSGSRQGYYRTRHKSPQVNQPSNLVDDFDIESVNSSDSGDAPPSRAKIIERCKKEAQEAVNLCESKHGWTKSVWEKKRDDFDNIDINGVSFEQDVKKRRDTLLGEFVKRLVGEKKKGEEKGDKGEVEYLKELIKKVQGWAMKDVTE
ncbi:hypothetical protein ACEPAF_2415 [Sanghuangporus sanghuang]